MNFRLGISGSIMLLSLAFAGYGQDIFDAKIMPADALTDQYVSVLRGKKIGLIINQTSTIGDSSLLEVLLSRGLHVSKIFVPEHGFRGSEDAGAKVDNAVDSATGIPVISLYGSHKKPRPGDLADVDELVYDLQDVGARFYTYISTLEYAMEACAENHVAFMVLDRPNPNGFYVDGPVLEPAYKSFVGMQQVPVVYGMTVGEYAQMLKGEGWFAHATDLDLKVVKCAHYDHSKKYKLPVPPSPNLRDMAAIYAYPSLCLFEGTVVSVGRGTNGPFLQYGCPEFEGKFQYRFTPLSGAGAKSPPYESKVCYGEKVGATAEDVLTKLNNQMDLEWLIKAYNAYPDKEKFFNGFFTKLSGTQKLEDQVRSGASAAEIQRSWQPGIDSFKIIRRKYLLYRDFEK
jgi:uncharacterized protein YbbC (DUF1343 family)